MATTDRATLARREREYEAARDAADLERLQQRWAREDDAAAAAKSWQMQETRELGRRLAAVERTLGHDGRRIVDALVGAIGAALRRVRQEEREHTAAAIQTAFDQRCLLDYKGIWSAGQSYVKGSAVTDRGRALDCNRTMRHRPAPGHWRQLLAACREIRGGEA